LSKLVFFDRPIWTAPAEKQVSYQGVSEPVPKESVS
jgi:hypothetical protein